MKNRFTKINIIICLALGFAVSACWAQNAGKHKFVGVKKCSMCHKGEKNGTVFEKWLSSSHAKAFQTLSSAQSEKIAKEKGLKTPANQSKECLECHATAYGIDTSNIVENSKLEISDGVQCEDCHGAAGDYIIIHAKKGNKDKAIENGMILSSDEKSCTKCHNKKSPTFKAFNFKEATAKIAHSLPKN